MTRITFTTLMLALACGDDSTAPVDAGSDVAHDARDVPEDALEDAGERVLPNLPPGVHPGAIIGFSPLIPANRAPVEAAWDELLAAGLRVGRAQISWRDLEPSPGVYDLDALRAVLDPLREEGLHIFLTLETIDSSGFEIPDDLLDDELTLAEGRRFDDPVITDRFAGVLDAVLPVFEANGGYAVTVGNEPDNLIDDVPSFGPEVAGFTAAARDHGETVAPDIGISMTLTLGAITGTYAAPIVEGSDFLSINYYCQGAGFTYKERDVVLTELDAIAELADGKPVVFQELGCSAGFDTDRDIEGSDVQQQEFLTTVLQRLRADDQTFRAAYWFTLLDFSPEVAALISDPLCAEGFPVLCRQVDEAVQTYGLLRWADGSRRPGFETLANAIRE